MQTKAPEILIIHLNYFCLLQLVSAGVATRQDTLIHISIERRAVMCAVLQRCLCATFVPDMYYLHLISMALSGL